MAGFPLIKCGWISPNQVDFCHISHSINFYPFAILSSNSSILEVAIVPNSNQVSIYSKKGNSFTLSHTLSDHDKLVTCIDWAPKTNRIVTCSQDRNAYVWCFENGLWVPTLVLLRINRAATSVRWSPKVQILSPIWIRTISATLPRISLSNNSKGR